MRIPKLGGNAKIVVFALVFAGIGTVLLVFTKAAVPSVAVEAENGTQAGPVTVISDSSASGANGGQAILFSAAATPTPPPSPTPNANPSGFCDSFPALPSVKPDATNTGVPAGTTLTASGDITVSTAGTVIDGKDINGTVTINADNVTIKNSKIRTSGYWAVKINSGTGHKIINNEIYTTNGGYEGIVGADATVCGNYIHGYENAMTVDANMIIQANYIDKLASSQSGPHYDGIEVYGGSNSKIWGNNIRMTDVNGGWLGETGAINITTEWSNITNVDIRGNWLGGGSYTLYIRKSSGNNGNTYSNISVVNNRWYGSAPKGFASAGAVSDDGGSITFTGNVWDATGQAL